MKTIVLVTQQTLATCKHAISGRLLPPSPRRTDKAAFLSQCDIVITFTYSWHTVKPLVKYIFNSKYPFQVIRQLMYQPPVDSTTLHAHERQRNTRQAFYSHLPFKMDTGELIMINIIVFRDIYLIYICGEVFMLCCVVCLLTMPPPWRSRISSLACMISSRRKRNEAPPTL